MKARRLIIPLALSISAAADARSVQQFMIEAERARAAGMAAALDGSIRSLMDEANGALAAWKAQQQSARPEVCAPAGAEDMPPSEFMGLLRTIPPRRRASTSLRNGIVEALNRRYRCHEDR